MDTNGEVSPTERWPSLLFQSGPEGRPLENRLYLILAPPEDGKQQAEIRRLEKLGAKIIAVGEDIDLVIMEDPEGNGFSVLGPRGPGDPRALPTVTPGR